MLEQFDITNIIACLDFFLKDICYVSFSVHSKLQNIWSLHRKNHNSEYFVLNRIFCTLSKNHVKISFLFKSCQSVLHTDI